LRDGRMENLYRVRPDICYGETVDFVCSSD